MNIKRPLAQTVMPYIVCLVLIPAFLINAFCQTPAKKQPEPQPSPTPSLEKEFFRNILRDQKAIWLAPFQLKKGDGKWLFPLAIGTGALLATDRQTAGELVNEPNPDRLTISRNISYLGSYYTAAGVAGTFYLVGRMKNDDRARETGLLAAEAVINSTIVVLALKAVSQRPRPPEDNTSGEFFEGGGSFPSGHAINAWSLATIIDQEYGRHRPLVRIGVYGLAAAVSISRYTGERHFLSDVLVGSALGFGIGRYVYHQHHNPELDAPGQKKTSSVLPSKFFPRIAPIYYPRKQIYGATLAWNF